VIAAYDDGDQPKQVVVCPKIVQPPITVIIGGRALLMLIAVRFSGSLLKKISRQLAPAVKG
jgi:hypothetical protein